MFFVEDDAQCPNFVDQSGWEYLSGLSNYADNRIRLDCVSRNVQVLEATISQSKKPQITSQKTGTAKTPGGCCGKIDLGISNSESDQLLNQMEGVFTYNKALSSVTEEIFTNDKGTVLQSE